MAAIAARAGVQFNAYEKFEIITCCKCGMPFGVPQHWKVNRREDKGTFFCPNGHSQSYHKSTAEILREDLCRTEGELVKEKNRTNDARKQRDSSRRAHKRMRYRVKNGVCPCCHRQFDQLVRHMLAKHPEYGVAKSLLQIRELNGLTQHDLALEIGVNTNHISCFERDANVTLWASDQIEAWLDAETDE